MTESSRPKPAAATSSGGAVAVVCFLLLCALPLLYFLSIGPIISLESRGRLEVAEDSPLVYFYEPLEWVCESNNALESIFAWYTDLWSD